MFFSIFLTLLGLFVLVATQLPANDTEFFAFTAYDASQFEKLKTALEDIVTQDFSMRIKSVPNQFAQQNGVYPEKGNLQLENFGALNSWTEIVRFVNAHSSHKLLIMIRHGQAWENLNPYSNSLCEFQLNGVTIPNFDSPLTPLGEQEAVQLHDFLASSYYNASSTKNNETMTWFEAMGLYNATFVASPLSRTMQTADRVLADFALSSPVAVSELLRASIGTDVCNARRAVLTPTSSAGNTLPAPWDTGCDVPADSLSQLYAPGASAVNFSFVIRPAGGVGFGLVSDNDILWRNDIVDESHQTRARAFINQLFEYSDNSIVLAVTHGEMINAVYEALGENPYSPLNTEVVPILLEQIRH
jgi:broad specificity phosphatase PhoE